MNAHQPDLPLDVATWKRVDHLFGCALDLPPAAWLPWLEAEEPDPAIRERVMRLLWVDAAVESRNGGCADSRGRCRLPDGF